MNSYFTYHNLITVKPNADHHTENSILFLAEYCLIYKQRFGKLPFTRSEIQDAIEFHRVGPNRFIAQPEDYDEAKENPWSHDNHTGVVVLSILYKLPYHYTLSWDYLKYRIQPWNLAFYVYAKFMDTPVLNWFFYSLAYLVVFIKGFDSMLSKETSGKILTYVHMSMLGMTYYRDILAPKMSAKYGQPTWESIFAIYFKAEDHPINKLMRK